MNFTIRTFDLTKFRKTLKCYFSTTPEIVRCELKNDIITFSTGTNNLWLKYNMTCICHKNLTLYFDLKLFTKGNFNGNSITFSIEESSVRYKSKFQEGKLQITEKQCCDFSTIAFPEELPALVTQLSPSNLKMICDTIKLPTNIVQNVNKPLKIIMTMKHLIVYTHDAYCILYLCLKSKKIKEHLSTIVSLEQFIHLSKCSQYPVSLGANSQFIRFKINCFDLIADIKRPLVNTSIENFFDENRIKKELNSRKILSTIKLSPKPIQKSIDQILSFETDPLNVRGYLNFDDVNNNGSIELISFNGSHKHTVETESVSTSINFSVPLHLFKNLISCFKSTMSLSIFDDRLCLHDQYRTLMMPTLKDN